MMPKTTREKQVVVSQQLGVCLNLDMPELIIVAHHSDQRSLNCAGHLRCGHRFFHDRPDLDALQLDKAEVVPAKNVVILPLLREIQVLGILY